MPSDMKAQNRPVYLDYNATTPLDPSVLEAMLPYFQSAFGNPSSTSHNYGWEAQMAVEKARKQVATLLHCQPKEIFWTSGATESNNLALYGVLQKPLAQGLRTHLITSAVEHKAIHEVAKAIESLGAEVTFLPVDSYGQVSPQEVEAAIQPHTRLISIIAGQNEIGTINPLREIGAIARKNQILFHVDAAQAVGKMPLDLNELSIDLLSASGHKMYGPKGIGFLFVRKGVELTPLFQGGAQEQGLRPGTLNVPAIVGLGQACEIFSRTMHEEIPRLSAMRDLFIETVLAQIPTVRLNGHRTERLYSNISLSFEDLSSDVFALGLSGLAVSTGSACSAGAPSHVLPAIGLSEPLSRSTIRLSIGRFTKPEDLHFAAEKLKTMVQRNLEFKAGLPENPVKN
jgi:cysteine desulfurase